MKNNNQFTYTLNVTGMKCGMCESHINTAIRNRFNVKKVTSSRKKNTTIVISNEEIDINELINLIKSLGYNAS